LNQKTVIYIILSAILLYLYYKRGGIALFVAFVVVVAGTLFADAGAREGMDGKKDKNVKKNKTGEEEKKNDDKKNKDKDKENDNNNDKEKNKEKDKENDVNKKNNNKGKDNDKDKMDKTKNNKDEE